MGETDQIRQAGPNDCVQVVGDDVVDDVPLRHGHHRVAVVVAVFLWVGVVVHADGDGHALQVQDDVVQDEVLDAEELLQHLTLIKHHSGWHQITGGGTSKCTNGQAWRTLCFAVD